MRYSIYAYARAFVVATEETPRAKHEAIVKNFAALIRRRGRARDAAHIVAEIERRMVRAKGGTRVVIETARPLAKKWEEKLKALYGAHDAVTMRVRPELIAGARLIEDESVMIDASLRRKLRILFRENA